MSEVAARVRWTEPWSWLVAATIWATILVTWFAVPEMWRFAVPV